jgi:hypothetical protein
MKKQVLLCLGFVGALATDVVAVQAQTMTKMYVGRISKLSGNKFQTVSLSSKVVGDKCVNQGRSKMIGSGYIIDWVDTFDAKPQGDGFLCTNGTYRIVGQDGKTFTGKMSYDLFMKDGVAWEINRPQ